MKYDKSELYITKCFIFSGILLCSVFCSSPQVEESPIVEEKQIETVVKRAWTSKPLCCQLNSISLDVVVLNQICVSQFETTIQMLTTESKRVCVLKEGLVFRDNFGSTYSFLKSDGVGVCPKRVQMKNKEFQISFESLQPDAKSFDLIEDKNAKHAHKPWSFIGVDLTNCNWQ